MPPDGVMTHLDYTSYAHAILMRRLIGQPSYTTIYMDQDEVLRGAYTSAWTCPVFVPLRLLTYAAFASKAKGLFQPSAECLRRGL